MTRIVLFSLILFVMNGYAATVLASTPESVRDAVARVSTQPATQSAGQRLHRFYDARSYRPLWNEPKHRAELLDQLHELRDDGLDPGWYGFAHLEQQFSHHASGSLPPELEIEASRAYLQAIIDLTLGRVTPERPEAVWRFGDHTLAPGEDFIVVRAALDGDDLAAAFDEARPRHFGYRALRDHHRTLREEVPAPAPPPVPEGAALRSGTRDDRVVALRARLSHAGHPALPQGDAALYDPALEEVVKRFQEEQRLARDGIVGPATLTALNRSHATQLRQVRVNLERLRWVAHDLRSRLLLSNIPSAEIEYLADGRSIWSARAQVGRTDRPTPALISEITHFTVNPTWTIPPTIMRNDKLPQIRRDLGYLERNNLRVIDHDGNTLSPTEVDWNNPSGIMLRQTAGPHNALGRVAIRFPNPFLVYLHDTPNQSIFDRDNRGVSSGCVRVETATDLVALIIEDRDGNGEERLNRALQSGRTQEVRLDNPVPVLLAYWTVTADEAGTIHYLSDIYNRDEALLDLIEASATPAWRPLHAAR